MAVTVPLRYLSAAVPVGIPHPLTEATAAVTLIAESRRLDLVSGPEIRRKTSKGTVYEVYTWRVRPKPPGTTPAQERKRGR